MTLALLSAVRKRASLRMSRRYTFLETKTLTVNRLRSPHLLGTNTVRRTSSPAVVQQQTPMHSADSIRLLNLQRTQILQDAKKTTILTLVVENLRTSLPADSISRTKSCHSTRPDNLLELSNLFDTSLFTNINYAQ